MEENISYRFLKKCKPLGIDRTSQSLLQPSPHKNKPPLSKGIMAKNVSVYQHMLGEPHAKENYIDWAINLRNSKKMSVGSREPQTGG